MLVVDGRIEYHWVWANSCEWVSAVRTSSCLGVGVRFYFGRPLLSASVRHTAMRESSAFVFRNSLR